MRRLLLGPILGIGALATLAGCQSTPAVKISQSGESLLAAKQALTEGEAGTSLAIAKGILASQPTNVAALTQAGDAEAAMGDRMSAQASYSHALALAPNDLRARLGEGKLQIRDDLHAAETTFRGLLAGSPHNPVVLNDLGYVLDLQGRHAEAQSMYQAAIAVDPERLPARVNLALSLALSGQAQRAEQMLRDIAATAGAPPKVRLDFAAAQVIAGHDKDAAQTLAAELTPQETKSAIEGLEQLRQTETK